MTAPPVSVEVSGHAVDRWRQRIDARDRGQIIEFVQTAVVSTGRRDYRGVDENGHAVWWGRTQLPAGHPKKWVSYKWTVSPATGEIVVRTVTAGYKPRSNEMKQRSRTRRGWGLWVEWCQEHRESPICNPAGYRRFVDDHLEYPTGRYGRVPNAIRQFHRDQLGIPAEETLDMFPAARLSGPAEKHRWLL